MIRARVEINKQLLGLEIIKLIKPLKLYLRVLEKFTTPFRTELKKRFYVSNDEKNNYREYEFCFCLKQNSNSVKKGRLQRYQELQAYKPPVTQLKIFTRLLLTRTE